MNALTLQDSTRQTELVATTPAGLRDQSAGLQPEFPAFGSPAPEEFLNTLTHGCGFLLAVVGARLMVGQMVGHADSWLIVGCGVYLVSLLGVYSMSTLSHGATCARWKTFFRQLDQGFIYLLIVASYTPFSVAYLHGPKWTAILCGMWALALAGFIAKVFFAHRVDSVSVAAPMLLAWVPVVSLPTLLHTAPAGAYEMIIAGGVCYTVGILFFINDGRGKNLHAVWHLCVIAGSTCHFLGILNYVLVA